MCLTRCATAITPHANGFGTKAPGFVGSGSWSGWFAPPASHFFATVRYVNWSSDFDAKILSTWRRVVLSNPTRGIPSCVYQKDRLIYRHLCIVTIWVRPLHSCKTSTSSNQIERKPVAPSSRASTRTVKMNSVSSSPFAALETNLRTAQIWWWPIAQNSFALSKVVCR